MIWVKTEAGRAEMKARSLIKDRARRNLLLLIDGIKPEAMLLANLTGISADDFQELRKLELIAPAAGAVSVGDPSRAGSPDALRTTIPQTLPDTGLDSAQFSAALTKLVSTHLGLRGFTLALAVENAATIEELLGVAQRVLEQIRERKGEAIAAVARQSLYRG